MKKILYILSLIVVIFALVACNNEKPLPENPATDFEYIKIDNSNVIIWEYIGTSTTVVIPKEIDGVKVDAIRKEAFYQNEIIETVVIPDTITEIRAQTFESCKSLETVVFPEGLTAIGESAFAKCTNLSSISFPQSLKTLGKYAFAECKKLSSISFPQSLTILEDGCFENCKSLKYIKIPKTIEKWGSAFRGAGIETVEFEEGLEKIGWAAFSETPIKKVTLPQSLKIIGDSAFYQCQNLTDVQIGKNLEIVGSYAFSDCDSLRSIDLSMDTLTTIGEGTFSNCDNLTEVVFGDNISVIYDKAFMECISLKTLTLPKHLEELGELSFGYCYGINSINIPKSVSKWGNHVFVNNTSLSKITFEDGIENIGYWGAFQGCSSLKSVTIPASVKRIDSTTFSYCDSLEKAIFLGNAPEYIGYNSFGEPKNSFSIYYAPETKGWDTTILNEYNLLPFSKQ